MIPELPRSPGAYHIWQSKLFAAAAGLLATCLRNNAAQLRYRVWMAAPLKFLVPFSPLVALGSRLSWRTGPAAGDAGVSLTFAPAGNLPHWPMSAARWTPMRPVQILPGTQPSAEQLAMSDPSRPTLAMIFDRLGLKLESQKAPVDMYVIEHVERPTEN